MGKRKAVDPGVRVVAFVLNCGGAMGIALPLLAASMFISQLMSATMALMAESVLYLIGAFAVYVWCIKVGVDLWRGEEKACKWAKILLAAQILSLRIPGFVYQFQTLGLTINFLVHQGVKISFGSSMSVYLSSAVEGTAVGVNIVAIVALSYLWKVSSHHGEPEPVSNNLGLL